LGPSIQWKKYLSNIGGVEMRKTTMFLLVLLGMATATAVGSAASSKNAVTIALSRPVVVYGGSVTLSGAVSSHKAGEPVTVMAEASGASSFSALATVNTGNAGKWSYLAKPTIETRYEAEWKSATSQIVIEKVRPLITLKLVSLASRTFSTTVTAARPLTGKFVLVQRLTASGTHTLKKLVLDANSSATFHVRLHRGRNRLRVVMPTSQAAPGYISGASKVLGVRR
jgi:hypothetical protein